MRPSTPSSSDLDKSGFALLDEKCVRTSCLVASPPRLGSRLAGHKLRLLLKKRLGEGGGGGKRRVHRGVSTCRNRKLEHPGCFSCRVP